ncbi:MULTISPECIES: winged helix-turn-helix transcriptional regulator [unclassified Streptomyces]|uniref:winged helix-turn-helix transcriptional regulator n=1 Tax=unclassified Streptomyces TaxID=2593676 RepID=UPI0036E2F18B
MRRRAASAAASTRFSAGRYGPLGLVGDKWSMLVIGALAGGDARYSDLDTTIPAISRRVLTLTLKRLQRSGLVDRTSYPEVPPRVEYSLTALGSSARVCAGGARRAACRSNLQGRCRRFETVRAHLGEAPRPFSARGLRRTGLHQRPNPMIARAIP